MHMNDPFTTTLQEWVDVFMRRSMHNFTSYARKSGLSMSQIGALFHIHHGGGCGVTELGNHLGISSAAASQLLERLVLQDLILRTEDPADRRVKQLLLTDKGMQTIQESIHARQGWLNDLEKSLSPSEKEQIVSALKILIDEIKDLEHLTDSEKIIYFR
jgi:DNA-binding MarR family transcriptional regulator